MESHQELVRRAPPKAFVKFGRHKPKGQNHDSIEHMVPQVVLYHLNLHHLKEEAR